MNTRDVQIGETYLVEVPHQLPQRRYPHDDLGLRLWWTLNIVRGTRFPLTITDVSLDREATWVEGLRVVNTAARSEVNLTAEQAIELGLPPGAYRLEGTITAIGGGAIDVPEVSTLRVPARWLHPRDAHRPPTHSDVAGRPW